MADEAKQLRATALHDTVSHTELAKDNNTDKLAFNMIELMTNIQTCGFTTNLREKKIVAHYRSLHQVSLSSADSVNMGQHLSRSHANICQHMPTESN